MTRDQWFRTDTWAAITRCLSRTNKQPGHRQSRHRQRRLWPFKQDITPWLRHRAHFGVRKVLRLLPSFSQLLSFCIFFFTWNVKMLHFYITKLISRIQLYVWITHDSESCSRWNVFSEIDGCKVGFKLKTFGGIIRPALQPRPLVERTLWAGGDSNCFYYKVLFSMVKWYIERLILTICLCSYSSLMSLIKEIQLSEKYHDTHKLATGLYSVIVLNTIHKCPCQIWCIK